VSYCEKQLYFYERFRDINKQCSDDSFTAARSGSNSLWANHRKQADIGFFKIFDFMIDMASFNVQTNKKERIFQFSKNVM
jgi:hypothetical protein